MGPLFVPKQGSTIILNADNFTWYKRIIEFETSKIIESIGDSFLLDGSPLETYTFLNDYYFFGGDNVVNSNDSRYWGFVPDDFIVGIATHVLYSRDRSTNKLRWNRLWVKL